MLVLRTSSNLFDQTDLQLIDSVGIVSSDIADQTTSIYVIYTRISIMSTNIGQIIV